MNKLLTFPTFCTAALVVAGSLSAFGQGGSKADYNRAASLNSRTQNKTFRTKVEPHWLKGGDSFWYRNDLGGGRRSSF
jgi:hypothetical protein